MLHLRIGRYEIIRTVPTDGTLGTVFNDVIVQHTSGQPRSSGISCDGTYDHMTASGSAWLIRTVLTGRLSEIAPPRPDTLRAPYTA